MALSYHAGQVEVQSEANSRPAAEMLAERTSGRSERVLSFYAAADLVVLATADPAGLLRFTALSGDAPLVSPSDAETLLLHDGANGLHDGSQVGAIAIDLRERRRARANGTIRIEGRLIYLRAAEELINCRKYIAPSVALEPGFRCGPAERQQIAVDDSRLREVMGHVETAFLASVSPSGRPDVSHKGGPTGFMHFDADSGVLTWPELIGNGMFKSAGNVRATGTVSILALDLDSGDAYELCGRGEYRTELRYAEPRDRGLWLAEQDFPTQGVMTVQVEEAALLKGMILPRRRVEAESKITACSPVEDQVPK
ncbi:MAG TPA: pyridoxamine 5'-phosphate oxidase family protein [Dehalococcoidia bacterium]|nr:pyridoxamine 5'-phosphate oxidase family protein [Dehalococcoidia bacterium]